MKSIATKKVFAVHKSTKEEHVILFEISEPESIDNGQNYMCTVQINEPDNFSQRVGGADSMQALSLAITLAKNKFGELQDIYDFYFDKEKKYSDFSFDYSDVGYPQAP